MEEQERVNSAGALPEDEEYGQIGVAGEIGTSPQAGGYPSHMGGQPGAVGQYQNAYGYQQSYPQQGAYRQGYPQQNAQLYYPQQGAAGSYNYKNSYRLFFSDHMPVFAEHKNNFMNDPQKRYKKGKKLWLSFIMTKQKRLCFRAKIFAMPSG